MLPDPVVLTPADQHAQWPIVVRSADGAAITALWKLDPADPAHATMQSSTSNDGGATWSAPSVVLKGEAVGDLHDAELASSADGQRLVASWINNGAAFVQYSADAGATWGQPVEAPSGWVHVTRESTDGLRLTALRITESPTLEASASVDGGVTWSSPEVVAAVDAGATIKELFGPAYGRTVTVVWGAARQEGDLTAAASATSSDAGASWSAPASWSGPVMTWPMIPGSLALGTSEGGNKQVAAYWEAKDDPNWHGMSKEPWLMRASARTDGGAWSTPATLSAEGEAAEHPFVAISDDGARMTVAWYHSDLVDGRLAYTLQASSSSDGGVSWSPAAKLSEPGAEVPYPWFGATSDAAGLALVWTQYDPSGRRRIQGAFTSDGGASWSGPLDVSPRDDFGLQGPRLAMTADGKGVSVAWWQTASPLTEPAEDASTVVAVSSFALP